MKLLFTLFLSAPLVSAFVEQHRIMTGELLSVNLVPQSFPLLAPMTEHQDTLLTKAEPSRTTRSDSARKAATSSSNVHHATTRNKWGVDNKHRDEYWFDARIHTLGNRGIMGAFHAALAPLSTKLIDVMAYDGQDIRQSVADELSKTLNKGRARVIDLCCGVGISTRALRAAFPDAEAVIGVDTSAEMVEMAKFLSGHLSAVRPYRLTRKLHTGYTIIREQGKKLMTRRGVCCQFTLGNAEDTKLPSQSFDLVTVMYAFHEAPKQGRERIVAEARRLLQPGGLLAIIDISTDYTPSPNMLMGEPYVLEYQQNIHRQLDNSKGFLRAQYKTLVPGHVGMWLLKRAPNAIA